MEGVWSMFLQEFKNNVVVWVLLFVLCEGEPSLLLPGPLAVSSLWASILCLLSVLRVVEPASERCFGLIMHLDRWDGSLEERLFDRPLEGCF